MINFKELDNKEKSFSIELDNFLNTRSLNSSEVSSIVAEIITSVRSKGDEAIRFYTKKLDKFDCDDFLVSDQELNVATENIEQDLIRSFEYAFDNILSYQSGCYETLAIESSEEQISRRFRAINSVGMYIPGGKASYPSTVLMGAAPAIACGIKDICLTTPLSSGTLNGLTLAAAKVAGIKKIYKIGGAQAVAALALGTEQVLKVDKICLLYTSPSPRDQRGSRMPSSA